MPFVTYENRRNPHVTIHLDGCAQIAKRGGEHRHGQGEYRNHSTYEEAKVYAEVTGLLVIECSYCFGKPPPAVRILTLHRRECCQDETGAKQVQQTYFLDQMVFKQSGYQHFATEGFEAEPGTVVLIHLDGKVVASATYLRSENLERPSEEGYKRTLEFALESVHRIDPPIDENEIKMIWPDFAGFGHISQSLDPKRYAEFKQRVGKRGPSYDPVGREVNPAGAERDAMLETQRREQRQSLARPGQQQFRDAVVERYGRHCLVTGSNLLAVLEAAHIHTSPGEDDNRPGNGLLLRADVHRLFDQNLLGIEPTQLRVEVHPDASKEYGYLADKILACEENNRPSRDALADRYEKFKERLRNPA